MLKQILQAYPADVRVVFKQFPLVSIHPNAKPAAMASVAAWKQNKFWEMHDLLYQNQRALDAPSMRRYAESLGLDMAAYDKVLSDPETTRFIDKEMLDGQKAGVGGTPTFFVDGVQSPMWDFGTMQKLIEASKSGGDVSVVAGQIRADMMAQQARNRPQPPDPNMVYQIDLAGAPSRGPAAAPITLVEFSDYQ